MKVGFLDDERDAFADYKKRLSKYGIELIKNNRDIKSRFCINIC